MSEVQETGTSRQIETESIKEPKKQNEFNFTRFVTAIAISCLMIGSGLTLMAMAVLTTSTPSIPTVIEPGSMVSSADYIIFKESSTYYGKNATSGRVTYSSADALTIFDSVVAELTEGGVIFVHKGNYSLYSGGYLSSLNITNPQISIRGESSTIPNEIGTPIYNPNGTRIYGSINVKAPNTQLENLAIMGVLNISSENDFSEVADFCTFRNLYLYGGLEIAGLSPGVSAQVPYSLTFNNIYVNGIRIHSYGSGAIEHLYFYDSQINQGTTLGSVVWVGGTVADVSFINCLFITYVGNPTVFNLTGGSTIEHFRAYGCNFELRGSTAQVFLNLGANGVNSPVDFSISDSWFGGDNVLAYFIKNVAGNLNSESQITFTRLTLLPADTSFVLNGAGGFGRLKFINCIFPPNVVITQLGQTSNSASFINCVNVNPYGVISQPFSGVNDDWKSISIASGYSRSATPPVNKTVILYDTAILLTVSGGSGVSITVYDRAGTVVLTGASTLTYYYMPIGFKVNFGNFSGGPTFTVIGI